MQQSYDYSNHKLIIVAVRIVFLCKSRGILKSSPAPCFVLFIATVPIAYL